jgi:hypothetical protein
MAALMRMVALIRVAEFSGHRRCHHAPGDTGALHLKHRRKAAEKYIDHREAGSV